MKTLLKMPEQLWANLKSHLLARDGKTEQAAFLFVTANRVNDHVSFEVLDSLTLRGNDFASQRKDYLELKDETRARLIKRAHDLGASLVELHSHPGQSTASFSRTDRAGLKETVPHMWWRLPKRPYLALVVTDTGFDALVWLDNAETPQALDGLVAGDQLWRPTNKSLDGW